MKTCNVVLAVFILWNSIWTAGCLSCYACSLVSEKDKTCQEDVHRLVSSKLEMKGFVKNCSENESYCMIEKITTQYSLASYIRDCSDGYSFSYMQISRLKNIPANNASRCAFYNNHLVCVTLCKGDFCNGPQEISFGNTARYNINVYLLTFLLFYFTFYIV